jgi:hypothetical protein
MAAKKKPTKRSARPKRSMRLLQTSEKEPKIALRPGMRVEIVEVSIVDEQLRPKKVAARLCGGTTTCLALIEIE